MNNISDTFFAALRSVGTAATVAMGGFYLHRKHMVTPEGKSTLARISQQVTIPAFLFTKIVYCNQNNTTEPCPSVTEDLVDVWMLLLWPLYVVGMGLLVGSFAAKWSNTPPWQTRSVLAACGFANSTGLPITLLSVVHDNFPQSSKLGRVDPTMFLSVYLLLYPILQWGIGGWLLAPQEDRYAENKKDNDDTAHIEMGNGETSLDTTMTPKPGVGVRHVLNSLDNIPKSEELSTDEESSVGAFDAESEAAKQMIRELSMTNLVDLERANKAKEDHVVDEESYLLGFLSRSTSPVSFQEKTASTTPLANPQGDVPPLTETFGNVLKRALQPPVIGALLGLLVSSVMPLRGLFVDMDDRDDDAVLEWFFDGLYTIGQAAVPINMFILGINLSTTAQAKGSSRSLCSPKTVMAIVIGKMIVMPIVGIVSTFLLRQYVFDIPSSFDSAFYLVMMIVWITPTANNVMVMVELSGSGTKQGMAQVIGWQYATAPILLSLSVTLVVRVASQTG